MLYIIYKFSYTCTDVNWFWELLVDCVYEFVCFILGSVGCGCGCFFSFLPQLAHDIAFLFIARRCPKRENNLPRHLWKPKETRRSVTRWGLSPTCSKPEAQIPQGYTCVSFTLWILDTGMFHETELKKKTFSICSILNQVVLKHT